MRFLGFCTLLNPPIHQSDESKFRHFVMNTDLLSLKYALKTGANLRTLFIDNYIQNLLIIADIENPYNGKKYTQKS